MILSLKHRGPLAAASVVCLTLLSGGAWAEGADAAADPNQDRRTNPQTRPLGRDGNPAPPPPAASQQRSREPVPNANPQTQQQPQRRVEQERRRVEPSPNINPQTPPIPQQRRTETNREVQPQGEERRRREGNWRENFGRNSTGQGNTGQGNTGQGNFGQGNTGQSNTAREFGRRDNDRRDNERRDWRDNDRHDGRWAEHGWRGPSSPPAYRRHVYVGPHRYEVRPERRRVYRNVIVLRPYGGWYSGYGRYYNDRDAYRWLGLTAITFGVLSMLNEYQQRALEDAQIAATTAPIGAPIVWGDPYARGTVVATRDGWSDTGHYCREFQQTVEIGGRMEQAYGTACQQPDGSWQVIP